MQFRIFHLLILLIPFYSIGQEVEIRKEIQALADSLSLSSQVECGRGVGPGPVGSKYWGFYEELKLNAIEQELFQLAQSSDAVVKSYSYLALMKYSLSLSVKLLKEEENKSTKVKSGCFCVLLESTIFQFYLSRWWPSWLNKLPEEDQEYIRFHQNKNKEVINELHW